MKTFILAAILITGLAACEGTGDRTYKAPELDSGTGDVSDPNMDTRTMDDTTPTTNNNLSHTDSATGKGSAYDTSDKNNQRSQ